MTADWLGADRLIWGSDLTPPGLGMLNENISGLSPDDQDRIRGLNALDFYKLPRGTISRHSIRLHD